MLQLMGTPQAFVGKTFGRRLQTMKKKKKILPLKNYQLYSTMDLPHSILGLFLSLLGLCIPACSSRSHHTLFKLYESEHEQFQGSCTNCSLLTTNTHIGFIMSCQTFFEIVGIIILNFKITQNCSTSKSSRKR